ncbi:DUF1998 domain-containing protein [Pauljensenia sp. 20925_1_91]
MNTGTIRRAQLVAPFGVGAMSVLVDGTSIITAGLDHWYEADDPDRLEEYREHDWRLEARLRVKEFRLPPDYRRGKRGSDNLNGELTVPVLRFPRWHFCIYCKRLEKSVLSMTQAVFCQDKSHEAKGTRPRMSQVPFVVICTAGHLDDFPFDKWVHRSHKPSCNGQLRLKSTGGDGLEGQRVVCDHCKAERSLRGITETVPGKEGDRTVLSHSLSSPDDPYLCAGARPWLSDHGRICGLPVRGALRAAGNVYFPKVESSIYLPRKEGPISDEMRELMRNTEIRSAMRSLHRFLGAEIGAAILRRELISLLEVVSPACLTPISDEELIAGYHDMLAGGEGETGLAEEPDTELLTGDDEWRYPEFRCIRETPNDDRLAATDPGVHPDLDSYLERVRSVDVLRETRVLRGFTRVRDDVLKLSAGKALLRREPLPFSEDWLPAYVVKGEGIYLELDPARLTTWEGRPEVQARAQRIADQYGKLAARRGSQDRGLPPRFLLLHTLGHLLVNELIFTCGYSSASLRERLYVSTDAEREMAGLLIYTAAGDSEGTMGGLVRMARPANLRAVFASAISNARWCSSDPVCMEAGEKGQGPDSCNLAACHGCALLPETSCEEFNRFLDRGLVIGTFDDPTLGYFSDFV